jgi:hypothetical protein
MTLGIGRRAFANFKLETSNLELAFMPPLIVVFVFTLIPK